jgi:hypothetical protein
MITTSKDIAEKNTSLMSHQLNIPTHRLWAGQSMISSLHHKIQILWPWVLYCRMSKRSHLIKSKHTEGSRTTMVVDTISSLHSQWKFQSINCSPTKGVSSQLGTTGNTGFTVSYGITKEALFGIFVRINSVWFSFSRLSWAKMGGPVDHFKRITLK